jgi:hypothetical protein
MEYGRRFLAELSSGSQSWRCERSEWMGTVLEVAVRPVFALHLPTVLVALLAALGRAILPRCCFGIKQGANLSVSHRLHG